MKSKYYTVPLCLTHRCNLRCVYCYQSHDNNHEMSIEIAKECILDTLNRVETNATIEFILFGGEPLLRFDLITQIVDFVNQLSISQKCRFFAATNGVLLTEPMKNWFEQNKDVFVLGLSLDGKKFSHNINRPNSYDNIDIDFFQNTWPNQHVKMTVSVKTLPFYAEDIKFLHNLGFGINGADLCLGNTDWANHDYLSIFAKQLNELVDFYSSSDQNLYNALFDIDLAACATENKPIRKNCGVGDFLFFYDTDGKLYPCTFITPMTFSDKQINDLKGIDFTKPENFIDWECYNNCYLFPICKKCPAENLLNKGSFNIWSKSKCAFTELIALAKAEIETRRIIKNPHIYDDTKLFFTIEAITEIRSRYLKKYQSLINFMQ